MSATLFVIAILVVWILGIYLITDYFSIRIIKYRPEGEIYWRIAFSEAEMFLELDGRLAQVRMPARPIVVRWYKRLFPDKMIDISSFKVFED